MAQMEADQNRLIDHIAECCWFQRGGLTDSEAWNMSPRQRNRIIKQAQARMKAVEKSRLAII